MVSYYVTCVLFLVSPCSTYRLVTPPLAGPVLFIPSRFFCSLFVFLVYVMPQVSVFPLLLRLRKQRLSITLNKIYQRTPNLSSTHQLNVETPANLVKQHVASLLPYLFNLSHNTCNSSCITTT